MRQWRKDWPESYHQMVAACRQKWPEAGRGVQEFVRVLRLHEDYPAHLVQQAIEQALAYGCPHLDGVLHGLHHLSEPSTPKAHLDLSDQPHLQAVVYWLLGKSVLLIRQEIVEEKCIAFSSLGRWQRKRTDTAIFDAPFSNGYPK